MNKLTIPPLNEGEIYIGAIGDKDGNLNHIILLPGDNDDAPWQEQMDWAKSIGGDLPTRIEQAMLYAEFSEHFQNDWYWSNTTDRDPGYESCAWVQFFTVGGQDGNHKDSHDRARAVRRVLVTQ